MTPAETIGQSERNQAARAKMTAKQADLHAKYYERLDYHYLRLSAKKRAQGHGDCTPERIEAERLAEMKVRASCLREGFDADGRRRAGRPRDPSGARTHRPATGCPPSPRTARTARR